MAGDRDKQEVIEDNIEDKVFKTNLLNPNLKDIKVTKTNKNRPNPITTNLLKENFQISSHPSNSKTIRTGIMAKESRKICDLVKTHRTNSLMLVTTMAPKTSMVDRFLPLNLLK